MSSCYGSRFSRYDGLGEMRSDRSGVVCGGGGGLTSGFMQQDERYARPAFFRESVGEMSCPTESASSLRSLAR